MPINRFMSWAPFAASWILTAGLVAVTALIITTTSPASAQPPAGGPPDGGRGGPFSDAFADQLALNLGVPASSVRDALEQIRASRPELPGGPRPADRGAPPFGPGGPDGSGAPPERPDRAGGRPDFPREPMGASGAPRDRAPGFSRPDDGPPAGLPDGIGGPRGDFAGALAEQLASSLGLPVDTVQAALLQTMEQFPSPLPGGQPGFAPGQRGPAR